MYNPIATYRLQFHQEFTFSDFEAIIPYLQKLGVSTIYASPIFEAVPGSNHGYDGTNPQKINAELGSAEQLKAISQQLRAGGIGWLQDIVPNHMAFHPRNEWLMDVLEKGRLSVYAPYFDINWESPVYEGKIMVPFLGSPLSEVIGKGELKIEFSDRLVFKYYDAAYPLNRQSYASILNAAPHDQAVQTLLQQLEFLHQVEDPETYAQEWHEFLLQFRGLWNDHHTGAAIRQTLEQVNTNTNLLENLASMQVYQMCHWAETDRQINYRRFFTVNGLICLNIQDPKVFDHYHQVIKTMVAEGVFQGLRIDHVDGLYDPSGYLERLRNAAGTETYIAVEKILEQGEKLETAWPIQGTTGYEFLAQVNNLFTWKESLGQFTGFYHELTGPAADLQEQIHDKKRHILYQHMAGELDNLVRLFKELNADEVPDTDVREVLGEFLVHCPVYRFYGNAFPLTGQERTEVQKIIRSLNTGERSGKVADQLEKVLLAENEGKIHTGALHFYQRLMQFSGPLMAKGVEDTLMYTYNHFIGHNEVGDSPEAFGLTIAEFHELMRERQHQNPLSLNATSTHDTKRGEDVRARLNVLTDLGAEWTLKVREWQQLNASLKSGGFPDAKDEYFIYQSLLGAYPMPGSKDPAFEERIQNYLEKALREGKVHSNWSAPDQIYEEAAKKFAGALLREGTPFWESFSKFHEKVAGFGILNSLAQVLLKFTCPGIPDVYQGCEHWDLSFVDPDNRRPVDYKTNLAILEGLENEVDVHALWKSRFDGRIKVWLTSRLFRLRKQFSKLFSEGDYLPLDATGKFGDQVFAFARRYRGQWIAVAVPLHLARFMDDLDSFDWADTRLILPAEAPMEWQEILQNSGPFKIGKEGLALKEIAGEFPLLVIQSAHPREKRNAGLLLSVTSLPSAYGIGDIGPEAYAFADFLTRSNQKYWQLLPLNPTDATQLHSPYSSISSMAGNTLLISPDLLVKEGLLEKEQCMAYQKNVPDKADYHQAAGIRKELLETAWQNFHSDRFRALRTSFEDFTCREDYWLNEYALYVVLREKFAHQPWYHWPEEFKQRNADSLIEFEQEYRAEMEKEKFLQFIFHRQWSALKGYCNDRGIAMLGDLPFYVSYDSVDVWANKNLFSLDAAGNMLGMAGVPPDYFNDQGQLWGMPVFRWDVLKEQGYSWWIRRLRKNLELYDLIRLDHFRAFSAYWEVPAGEETAQRGCWKPGPGSDFFRVVRSELGGLPFLAEDLGDIDEPVYRLRDEFDLPGMKVLQFAFGQDLPESLNAPHNFTSNFFVYTGTHDNNTSAGWLRTEAKSENIRNIAAYTGLEPTEKNVHEILIRMAYASVAKTVIIPLQDLLGKDETARMNTPADTENNWLWRLHRDQLTAKEETWLRNWTELFNR
ncbi:MAG TPA: malto-oligosyltrehalose synthase [Sphingobacteriaceae bacterium]